MCRPETDDVVPFMLVFASTLLLQHDNVQDVLHTGNG